MNYAYSIITNKLTLEYLKYYSAIISHVTICISSYIVVLVESLVNLLSKLVLNIIE